MWLVFSLAAGLCWGTYVPFIQQGVRGLQSPYGSFLCVGIAYFLIAVLFPIGLFMRGEPTPHWSASGITFATLAGIAGALDQHAHQHGLAPLQGSFSFRSGKSTELETVLGHRADRGWRRAGPLFQ